MTVDLESQTITGPDGGSITFEIDPFRKHCLLNGLDDIGLTMERPPHRRVRGTGRAGAALGLTRFRRHGIRRDLSRFGRIP
jgi:3-isopropylmalate dehydratase small subunit